MELDKLEVIFYEIKKVEMLAIERAKVILDAEKRIDEKLTLLEARISELVKLNQK